MAVDAPTPAGPAADACAALTTHLPGTVDGRDRRETEPPDGPVAAWGDPPVVLRCGVPRPASLTATSEVVVVDDVEWFLQPGSAYVFTTVGRAANVEVRVPASVQRAAATAPLVDLAPAVRGQVPAVAG